LPLLPDDVKDVERDGIEDCDPWLERVVVEVEGDLSV
jgi:hypothetical protein